MVLERRRTRAIPIFAAYAGRGPLTIVQVDAHVDWGDVIKGNPYGYGSTMRRAAELPWITGMVQVGIRGLSAAPPSDESHGPRLGLTDRHLREPAPAGHGVHD